MAMKLAWNNLLRGLGAAAVAVLMVFTGLSPAGANSSDPNWCGANAGTTITWRSGLCGDKAPSLGLEAQRYSKDTGEIMWERESGAVGYEIFRDGQSLGVHDVLSWYMTGLQEKSTYNFQVWAVDRYGNYMGPNDAVRLYSFHGPSSSSYY